MPFTFRAPPEVAGGQMWKYLSYEAFDIGNRVSGMTLLVPTETCDPAAPWKEQNELVPAPTDAAGWAEWLEETGHVDVIDRREMLIGGAPATRFTLDLDDLPAGYECGGGRSCLALSPMNDPHAWPSGVGSGTQAGIEDDTREMTVIELKDRAAVVLATGKPDSRDEWLPAIRAVMDSLRFA